MLNGKKVNSFFGVVFHLNVYKPLENNYILYVSCLFSSLVDFVENCNEMYASALSNETP